MASQRCVISTLAGIRDLRVFRDSLTKRPKPHVYAALRHRPYSHAVQARRNPFRVAIVGSGPAGFYAAAKLIEKNNDTLVDMYEQLPVPFGLVRFGVAPDHPEVKNCQDRFSEVAESSRFNFIGNVHLGYDIPLRILQPHYDAILFAYGASKDRELGLPGERETERIYSARAFVGWYNGLPEYRHLDPDLTSGEDAIIIGQGNVALDVARALLTDVDVLRRTDMTDYALATLAKSRVRSVRIIGRRGPVQAAFTIKEVRELMQLPVFNKTTIDIPDADIASLPRPTKRILQLLKKGQTSQVPVEATSQTPKSWSLDFLLSPHALNHNDQSSPNTLTSVTFTRNSLVSSLDPSSPLNYEEHPPTLTLPCTTLFRSIGYKSTSIPGLRDLGITFDERRGIIPNDPSGRIISKGESGQEIPLPGLYAAGWVKRGPTGVIASTMTDAFVTAEAMLGDWEAKIRQYRGTSGTTTTAASTAGDKKGGWEGVRADAQGEGLTLRTVDWEGWKKIDRVEIERGKAKGKPREKFGSVEEMLEILQ